MTVWDIPEPFPYKWISRSLCTPEMWQAVLAWSEDDEIMVPCRFQGMAGWTSLIDIDCHYNLKYFSHWIPRPDPPQKRNKKEIPPDA